VEAFSESSDAYVIWERQVGLDFLEFRPICGGCSVSLLDFLEFFIGHFFSVNFPEGVL
jgi:hypothetical protein